MSGNSWKYLVVFINEISSCVIVTDAFGIIRIFYNGGKPRDWEAIEENSN